MKLPLTLFGYISRNFLTWFAATFFLIILLIFLGDFFELTRRAGNRTDIGFGLLLQMSALKLPYTAQEVLPFAVLFGAIIALWRMTRSQELIIARAAGVSVWQFLSPALFIAFLIGIIGVTLFNPLASTMEASFKQLEKRHLRNQADSFVLAGSGLWLRQKDAHGITAVIHAQAIEQQPVTVIHPVTINFFSENDALIRRIDAESGTLEQGAWRFQNAYDWRPDRYAQPMAQILLPTDLTLSRIEESFASPDTMSFWDLPGFANNLERSGFSALKHRLYFYTLLARPFLLCAMILIAAIFSLRMQRRGGTPAMIGGGVATGFLLYFLSYVVSALGNSATIPVILAAWTPAGVSMLLGVTFLLYLEDG